MKLHLFSDKKLVITCFPIIYTVLFISCGNAPTSDNESEYGTVVLKTQIIRSLLKSKNIHGTSFDSLIVEVNAADFSQPIRRSFPLSSSSLTTIDTLNAIPAGTSRIVKVWTINSYGNIIHIDSTESHTITIESGKCTSITINLIPVAGSIYLQLGSISTTIDSIEAIFTSDSGQIWKTKVKRSNRVYLTIDNIPHQTTGTLQVTTFNSSGTQLNFATTRIAINSFICESVNLEFSNNEGSLSMETTILLPAATVVSASLGASEAATLESGECIITEIMYSANDSEYIEIYNTTPSLLHYDTLTIDIDGTRRYFPDVTIQSRDYFVFGRKDLPWVDRFHSVQAALDLSSNGNWITLRTQNDILDQVIFSNGNYGLDWPDINGKRSIELDTQHYNTSDNNFGRYWQQSSTLITSSDHLYGTPGN